MANYTIISVVEEPGLKNGQPDPHIRVEFKVGPDGPFFERWLKAEFVDYAVQQKLTAFAQSIERLRA